MHWIKENKGSQQKQHLLVWYYNYSLSRNQLFSDAGTFEQVLVDLHQVLGSLLSLACLYSVFHSRAESSLQYLLEQVNGYELW